MMKLARVLFACALVLPLHALARPKVALVLSGGGARGFAHVGVLRALHDLRIPVDIVVGTSMGSVVGGAYAAGASTSDLERMASSTDWDAVVADRPARDQLAYRRRDEDVDLPSRIEFSLDRKGISMPPAAAGNAALEMALERLLPPGTRDQKVNELPLPFRSVASDLLTGELVELDNTPLFQTMRASLAVPGVFAPVRIKDHLVVDGGLVRNLPVDMARAMGADIVIAVNVGTPLAKEKELGSALGVANQMLQILTEQNVQRSIRELGPKDILIAPELDGMGFLDFGAYARAIEAGEKAVQKLAPLLQGLALPPNEFANMETMRLADHAGADKAVKLAQVNVEGTRHIKAEVLQVQSGLVPGQAVTREQVQQAAIALYGRGDLARVETQIQDHDGERSVTIRASESEWARNRMRVGLELASDFKDSNDFAIKLMHVRSSLNDWGAELRSEARLGKQRGIGVQWWQPLGPGAQWYVMPSAQVGAVSGDVFERGLRQSRVAYDLRVGSLALGRQLGNWGDLSVGVSRQNYKVHAVIPEKDPRFDLRIRDTVHFVRLNVDTLDTLGFPTRGTLLRIGREGTPHSSNSVATGQAKWGVMGLQAFHIGEWAGHVMGDWSRSRLGTAPENLGGFLRLSGTQAESIQAPTVLLSRLVLARRVPGVQSAFGTLRAGFSVEAGGGFDNQSGTGERAFRQAGSVFLSMETRIGPLFLGAGGTKGGDKTLYLFLGPIW